MLDLYCGTGSVLKLARMNRHKVLGIDYFPVTLLTARALYQKINLRRIALLAWLGFMRA